MREKNWVDCPLCGAKNSMRTRKGLTERCLVKGYSPIDVADLSGQFCENCGDGFWSIGSEAKMTRVLAQHMAREDAKRTVASDLATVKDAAEFLGVTPQAVHKMMTDGRLRYVETPGLRLPIRKGLEAAKKRAGRLAKPQGPRVRTRVGSSTRGSAASRKKRIVA